MTEKRTFLGKKLEKEMVGIFFNSEHEEIYPHGQLNGMPGRRRQEKITTVRTRPKVLVDTMLTYVTSVTPAPLQPLSLIHI